MLFLKITKKHLCTLALVHSWSTDGLQHPLLAALWSSSSSGAYLRGAQGLVQQVVAASSAWKMLLLCRVTNWRTWRLSWCSATKGTDGML